MWQKALNVTVFVMILCGFIILSQPSDVMSDMDKQFHEGSSSMLYLSDAPETEESLVTPKAGDVAGRPGLTPVHWHLDDQTQD